MDFSKLYKARYSVRAYKSDAVTKEALDQVLEAGQFAPTAANRQPIRVIVIETEGREAELQRIYGRDWFVQAPIVLCVCAIPEKAWYRKQYDEKNYADVDAAIVMDHMILQATELGLGTCWVGAFDPAAARQVLDLPEGVEPIAFTPLGYPDDEARPKKRKALDDLVTYDHW
ncbi:MAG: nitroreductase [Chloroflexi bacterium]|jgi:nitroreductase|nr:nitroreductase [Chloroflexota bacterium]